MKNELIIKNEDVNLLLHAVEFMSDVALGDITQIDYFTDEDRKAFEVLCRFLFPLVQEIHKERSKILDSLKEGENSGT